MVQRIRSLLAGRGLGTVLVKAATGSAGLRVVGMGFGFLVGIQLARGLGSEGYGIYGLAMSVIALLMVPTEFGLPQLVVRETAANATRGDWGKIRGILAWSQRVSLLSWLAVGALLVAAVALGSNWIGRDLSSALLVGLATIPLVAVAKTRSAALRGLRHIVKGQIPDVALRPAILSLLLLLAASLSIPLTPPLAMGFGAISAGGALLLALVMLARALPPEARLAKPQIDAESWRSSSIPMAMTEAMRIVQGHLAILMLGLVATASSVGIFKVATAVSVVVAAPTGILISVVAPSISSLFAANDRARLQKLLTWASIAMVAGVLAISLPFFIAGPALIELVFGHEFSAATAPLQILCAGAVLTATAGTAGTLLNMTGHERRVRRASLHALVLLVILLAPTILLAGATGAALATVMASLLWRFSMVKDCRRLLNLEPGLLGLLRKDART
ncbi:MAG TPA: oligosaccharide flippase family protein [Luteimonas sp.]